MTTYYELRQVVAGMVPRTVPLFQQRAKKDSVKEKGRKGGYQEFKLDTKEWVKQERLLNTEEINSFVEVSCRAAACPMPLNADVYDGLRCPFGCKYCFADSFRSTLYTAFFDNSKSLGIRHCNPDFYQQEFTKLMEYRGKDPHSVRGDVAKAIALECPVRFGIRFEDFLPLDRRMGVSLTLLRYLANIGYPVMINTKSDLVGEDDYVEALSKNKGKAAVHVTLISSNNKLLKALEPGAPSYERRIWAMKQLTSAGVRVVARIEPFLVFLSDPPDEVARYMEDLKQAGVKNLTFDTYSYTAKNPGIRQSFYDMGLDWDRLFMMGCDSQGLGSLLLGKFMDIWRQNGFSVSTFDMGNVPDNNQAVCCEVGDWFQGGYNYGCTVMAARLVQERGKTPTAWKDFVQWVDERGGFLSESLKQEVHLLWNHDGTNDAYTHGWARGMIAVGSDADGLIWSWENTDWREELVSESIRKS